jgi:hypothetical protein
VNTQSEFNFDFPATGGLHSSPQGMVCPPVQTGSGSFLKRCSKCKSLLDRTLFTKNKRTADGLKHWCIHCSRESSKKWQSNNKKRALENSARWRKNNAERNLENRRRWAQENKEREKERRIKWFNKNRDKINEIRRRYKKCEKAKAKRLEESRKWLSTTRGRIENSLRSRLHSAINGQFTKKACRTSALIGCSTETLISRIESMFLPGMKWENYGKYGWHIDHIKPCSSFDLSDEQQQLECFNYKNLQPLWAEDNLRKSNKIIS